jgi:type II secretory pathway component GspD/PulD (secretin)
MKKWSWILAFVVTFFLVLFLGFSQEAKPKMQQEIVKLKYIDKNEILSVLYTFASRDGRISPSPESGLITISDYPENVEKILEVIRRLDVKPADIQFTIQLVLGSAVGEEKSDEALQADPIIKELKSLLKYKSFSLLDTSFVRAIDRENSQVTMGKDADLRLELRPKYIKEEKEDLIQVETRLYKMQGFMQGQANQLSTSLLSSNFTMKSGDKTVVGVSKMDGGDKGLILIITGKVVR